RSAASVWVSSSSSIAAAIFAASLAFASACSGSGTPMSAKTFPLLSVAVLFFLRVLVFMPSPLAWFAEHVHDPAGLDLVHRAVRVLVEILDDLEDAAFDSSERLRVPVLAADLAR